MVTAKREIFCAPFDPVGSRRPRPSSGRWVLRIPQLLNRWGNGHGLYLFRYMENINTPNPGNSLSQKTGQVHDRSSPLNGTPMNARSDPKASDSKMSMICPCCKSFAVVDLHCMYCDYRITGDSYMCADCNPEMYGIYLYNHVGPQEAYEYLARRLSCTFDLSLYQMLCNVEFVAFHRDAEHRASVALRHSAIPRPQRSV